MTNKKSNQIALLAQLAAESKRDPREPFPDLWYQAICPQCKFPEGECDCSRYDNEGNEL